jgi:hypothetical protein
MARRRIYIKDELEKTLSTEAARLGIDLNDLIRGYLERASASIEIGTLKAEIKDSRTLILGCMNALESLAQEVGFTSGILASKSMKDPDALASGNANAKRLKALITASTGKGRETPL